jgi:primase-polymerase (primpol)-like protein
LFGADGQSDDVHANVFPLIDASLSDAELLERIRQSASGPKFDSLWSGTIGDYPSHSEADLALASVLAFWTQRDPVRIDLLFRQSKLNREKWETREDYRRRTIDCALKAAYAPPIPDGELPGADTERLRAVDVNADWNEAF